MESITLKTMLSALFLILTIVTGVLLKKSGEPYSKLSLAFHKIGITFSVVLVVLIIIQHLNEVVFDGIKPVLLIISGIFIVVAYVTGVMLTTEKKSTDFLKISHKIVSLLLIIMIPVIWVTYH